MSAIVTPSEFYRELISAQQPEATVSVVRNAIDPVPPAAPASARPYVGFAGRLSEEKGIDVLLEAAARCPQVQFRVAGEGPELDKLRLRQRALKADNVHFLGGMESHALEAEMRTWRVATVPSIWFENCPRVALEALRLGIPLVGSDIGGIPELVQHHGSVVPPGDSVALASAIDALWQDPAHCDELGARARAFIAAECTPQVHADRFETLLRAACASHAESRR